MPDFKAAPSEIRLLTPADEPFLWEMLYQAIYVAEGQPPMPREIVRQPEISRYAAGWGRPGDLGFAALAGGQPVGAAWLRLWSAENRGYGYVAENIPELSIAVLPEYRGQGLGERLMTRLLQAALAHYPAVSLSVSEGNPARRLYLRLGFREVSAEPGSGKMLWRPASV